jgi:uncharacterized membrane protein
MTDIFLFVGLAIFVIGGIGFLIAAFRTSLIWGLGCLLIAPVQIIYLLVHWNSAKGPFTIQLFGGLIMLAAAYLQGKISF